jgi:hypothetical protein
MKAEYVRKLIDMILEPADCDEQKLKEHLQKMGVDVEKWREMVRRYLLRREEDEKKVPGKS